MFHAHSDDLENGSKTLKLALSRFHCLQWVLVDTLGVQWLFSCQIIASQNSESSLDNIESSHTHSMTCIQSLQLNFHVCNGQFPPLAHATNKKITVCKWEICVQWYPLIRNNRGVCGPDETLIMVFSWVLFLSPLAPKLYFFDAALVFKPGLSHWNYWSVTKS